MSPNPASPNPPTSNPPNPNPPATGRRGIAKRVALPLVILTALLLSFLSLTTAANAQTDDGDGRRNGNNAAIQNDNNDNDDNNNDGRRNGRRGGGFRFDCEVSHFNDDDPIVFPGEVGAAHAHMFWGNTSTDAFSTTQSLLANAASTCDGRRDGNQAAYWTPVLFDAAGEAVEPTDIDVRYRGRRNVNPIPNGLEMLTTTDVLGAEANDFEIEQDGDGMEFEISYPNCLAVDASGSPVLSSDDNISHTAFSDGGDCPDSHPHRIPRLQISLEFDVDIDTDWRLASDHDGMAQGASLHADYMAAWTDDPPGS